LYDRAAGDILGVYCPGSRSGSFVPHGGFLRAVVVGQRRNCERKDYEAQTATYCKARKRLPESWMQAMVNVSVRIKIRLIGL
jgi:hypothetical protein